MTLSLYNLHAKKFFANIFKGCIEKKHQRRIYNKDHMQLAKPEISAVWSFTEKVCHLLI